MIPRIRWLARRRSASPTVVPSPEHLDEAQRKSEREAAQSANVALDYADGDEAKARFARFRSLDPFPSIDPALLNSADIADYVAATGMITPFRPEKLKTASYEVALLGPWFFIDDEGERVEGDLQKDDVFHLQPNSIAFMSVEPTFRLPDYIALRHNLKIDQIYKGLLVGTGPLIDPGFSGKIALPLHNLTENKYTLVGGQGIIWVEFTKLSRNSAWHSSADAFDRRGSYTNFPAERTVNKRVGDYVRDAVGLLPVPASSSAKVARETRQALANVETTRQQTERRVSQFSFVGIISVLAILLGFVPTLFSLLDNIAQQGREIQQLQDKLADLEEPPVRTVLPTSPGPATPVTP